MTTAVKLVRTGESEVLDLVEVEERDPGPGEVWIRHEAIGVNYLDVMQRKGTAPIALPGGIGLEAVGSVVRVGDGVKNVFTGQRVAYILGEPGAYAGGRIYPAERLVPVPDAISSEDAAALLFKGITAQYLIKSTYKVGPGTVVLLYGAAGGVGRLMAPWAKHLGATVIGVVSKDSSVTVARSAGCDHVIVWGPELPEKVRDVTGGAKAHVVYDGLGKTTFSASLDCLRPRGLMASIGASTGSPPPVEMSTLNSKGSLYVTRPSLAAHATDVEEYQERAADVFRSYIEGIITSNVSRTMALADVADAHDALENGAVGGAIVLKP